MTSVDVARNVSQRAGQINRAEGRVTDANIGIYTVPANKRARITDMRAEVTSLGVDATYGLAFKRGAIFTPISTPVANVSPTNITTASAITLEAGDILTNIGDAGSTNGGVNISATIEEFSS